MSGVRCAVRSYVHLRYRHETLLVMIYHVEIPTILFSISAAILEQLIYPPPYPPLQVPA